MQNEEVRLNMDILTNNDSKSKILNNAQNVENSKNSKKMVETLRQLRHFKITDLEQKTKHLKRRRGVPASVKNFKTNQIKLNEMQVASLDSCINQSQPYPNQFTEQTSFSQNTVPTNQNFGLFSCNPFSKVLNTNLSSQKENLNFEKFENFKNEEKENLNIFVNDTNFNIDTTRKGSITKIKKERKPLNQIKEIKEVRESNLNYLTNLSTSTKDTMSRNKIFQNKENITNRTNNNTNNSYTSYPDQISKLILGNKKILPRELRKEIFINLISEEKEHAEHIQKKENENLFNMFAFKSNLSEMMRYVLVEWIIDVHQKFSLQTRTLFLTIKLIDDFLKVNSETTSETLQLVGVTCFLIACKFEEMNFPNVCDCQYLTDNTYTGDMIKQKEKEVLKAIDYCISFPTIVDFYDMVVLEFNFTSEEYNLGLYFAHLFLLDSRVKNYKAYIVALALVYLVLKIKKAQNYSLLKKFFPDFEKEMKDCATDILYLLNTIENNPTVKMKFSTEEFNKVGLINIQKEIAP